MADTKEKKFHYGGQAVIEGVMMRGPKDFAIAVRRANGEIVTSKEDVEGILGRFMWLNKPFLRGTLALIDSMALGIKALKYSTDIAMTDAMDADAAAAESKEQGAKGSEAALSPDPALSEGESVALPLVEAVAESAPPPAQKSGVNDIAIGGMMVLGLLLGMGLFVFVPLWITRHFTPHLAGWERTAVAGCIKIVFFVAYVLAISMLKDIRRVFQYHGAEHKTINAYEAGEDLTVENVTKYTKVHVRCGTSFILVVLFTSILVFMFLSWDSLPRRFLYELLLLPVVAGISYEIIRFAGSRKDSIVTKMVLLPGLLMQKITTREPEPEMMEVAIRSLQGVLDREAAEAGNS